MPISNNVIDDSDNTADIDIRVLRECEDLQCELSYTGTASRLVPQATPPSSTTPVSGGCSAINENPANGTYMGDGGCGLSDAGYKIIEEGDITRIELAPFGNAPSALFTVNALNVNEANSTEANLSIKGVEGHSEEVKSEE